MMIIDSHAHVYPADYLDLLERIGVDPATTQVARDLRASSEPEDIAARLCQMDDAGVDVQVLSAVPQLPIVPDAEAALGAAVMVNDRYREILAEYPGRFLAYGALPVPHVKESLRELERIFQFDGFVGICLPTSIGDVTLDDPSLEPLWEALDQRSARVYIHAAGTGAHSPLIADHGLTWVNGAPVEDAIGVLHLLKADVPARFANIRFHIAHLAGDLLFLAQRIEDNYQHWGAFAHSPRESLLRMWFDSANFHAPSLRLARDTVGAERLLLGSDHPYFQDELYTRAVEYVRGAGLEGGEVETILSGRTLFGER
ncbi:amidohydrolase family protein [Trueperella sp.]|uniref:amidohydrolase family protein n=1 Tax=Trueperella sp. TaxID=2699835 RepID=UPI002630A341|nr:amidohydrolase family protein [Trueperella sp.]